jgi:hypothetical protein
VDLFIQAANAGATHSSGLKGSGAAASASVAVVAKAGPPSLSSSPPPMVPLAPPHPSLFPDEEAPMTVAALMQRVERAAR